MATPIEDAVLIAVARDGSLSSVEKMGFEAAQIAGAIRNLLREGRLVRNGSKFALGPGVTLPTIKRPPPKLLTPLAEYAVEKIDENAHYVIEHQTFTQIRERVRTKR
ncbi:hypothetical protein IFT59_05475 [Rhizobium sp. CFBP 8752]|uniref:hypothetical protein n=1 Tax=Rhizobium sp. CFBP 8752 TaxID=2775301 RepID=UPI00177DCE9F|nr:hypothetical protein [Rhizobium sp. CFBP 8752]MBD8662698.1 hypothetical protein [Rhizobium sp. CFBP 8752]